MSCCSSPCTTLPGETPYLTLSSRFFFCISRRRWSCPGAPGGPTRHPMWSVLANLELHVIPYSSSKGIFCGYNPPPPSLFQPPKPLSWWLLAFGPVWVYKHTVARYDSRIFQNFVKIWHDCRGFHVLGRAFGQEGGQIDTARTHVRLLCPTERNHRCYQTCCPCRKGVGKEAWTGWRLEDVLVDNMIWQCERDHFC